MAIHAAVPVPTWGSTKNMRISHVKLFPTLAVSAVVCGALLSCAGVSTAAPLDNTHPRPLVVVTQDAPHPTPLTAACVPVRDHCASGAAS
jgi:hypothetical protein